MPSPTNGGGGALLSKPLPQLLQPTGTIPLLDAAGSPEAERSAVATPEFGNSVSGAEVCPWLWAWAANDANRVKRRSQPRLQPGREQLCSLFIPISFDKFGGKLGILTENYSRPPQHESTHRPPPFPTWHFNLASVACSRRLVRGSSHDPIHTLPIIVLMRNTFGSRDSKAIIGFLKRHLGKKKRL
jgi:hypothetical protein